MRTCKYILICLISIFACITKTEGQSFKNITEDEQGDPVGGVFGITQGKDGFMWFGSLNGLLRYDTRTTRPYRRDAGNNPIFTDILDILCDSRGHIWVATGSVLTLYDPYKVKFTHFKHDSIKANSLSNSYVNCVIEDSKKRIWAGTQHGLNRIVTDGKTTNVTRYLQSEFKGDALKVKCLAEGKGGTLWVGTAGGLIKMPENGVKPELFRLPSAQTDTQTNEFLSIYHDEAGIVWLGNSGGRLIKFDPGNERFSIIENFKDPAGSLPKVREIISDRKGKLLLATSSGLAHFDRETGNADWYVNQPGDPNSLPDNSLYSAYLDNQGGLWLGSYFGGISYFHFNSPRFRRWPFPHGDPREKSFVNAWVGKRKDNRIWSISDKIDQLLIFDSQGKNPSAFPLRFSPDADYYTFYLDQNEVLWGGGNTMLTSYDTRRGTYRHYPFPMQGKDHHTKARTYQITEDSYGHFWVGGGYGLFLFDKKKGTFLKAPTVTYTATIFEDSHHNIWIGGHKGLYRIKPEAARAPMPTIERIPTQTDLVICWRIHEDRRGKIWAACHTDLLAYNPQKNQFELNKDIPREAALDVIPDNEGYIWINASNKLYRYHPQNRTVQPYSSRDGLPAKGTLMQGSGTMGQDGYLYFITDKGMFKFDPATISVPERTSPIVLTSLKLYNKTVRANDSTGILSESISKTRKIAFRHDQGIFTLDFALLDYVRPDVNKYAYKIDGIDRDWNYVKTPSATYTNLPVGSHLFQVKAANGEGVWMKEPLQVEINILPPWWRTWYAYLSYVLLAAAIVYAIIRFFWMRSSFRKEKALNQVKLDFFTNVSHEIRTHLSLISGPLEKAYEQSKEGKNVENNLGYARNNSDRLMLLVNELLDFRKIQSGGVRLQVQEYDVVKTAKSVIAAFEHSAEERDIKTSILCPDAPVMLWFDMGQMQKVFYNLLSNAYKFTPDGGRVVMRITEISNEVVITVEDSGKGISEEHLRKLFTYYYQADSGKPGYGIGLALSKSIVEEHRGYLSAESRLATDSAPGSTVLTIRMLRENRHFTPDQIAAKGSEYLGSLLAETLAMPVSSDASPAKRSGTILIIEDNDQLRVFIKELFQHEFHTLEAENGLRGLELANEHLPDIILSDVMMPGMNGLEVCSQLKNNIATSHIPVVLLTARTQNEQIIEGLAAGADDYLVKPFDPRILELKIGNLIRLRNDLKASYRQSVMSDEPERNSIARDMNDAFIGKLRTLFTENISDPDFGVNELAMQVGMSVSALYRKLKSLTGMTVNEFMKTIRLNEAKKLLESGVYNVGEVATIIGFEDSRHFSKEFTKAFGKKPNEIKKQVLS